jgi:hypothetical protein
MLLSFNLFSAKQNGSAGPAILKKEEVVLMDNNYAKRTVALPSRKNK